MKDRIYIVVASSGQYDDYRTWNHKAFKDPIQAEKEKEFLNKKYEEVPPFPFKGESEGQFFERWENEGITEQEEKLYMEWSIEESEAGDFMGAHVEEIELL